MADQQKTGTTSTTSSAAPAASTGAKAPAAESGDPAVHKLLADIQTAQLNGDSDAEKNLRKELADLGYE